MKNREDQIADLFLLLAIVVICIAIYGQDRRMDELACRISKLETERTTQP